MADDKKDDGFDLTQFYQIFFEEAGENLEQMEQQLLNLDLDTVDDEELNAIFRCAHSIKGGAATFGFEDVAELTHQMESLLDKLRRHELAPTMPMVDVLLEASDALKGLLGRHQGLAGEVPETAGLVGRIRALAQGEAAPAATVSHGPQKVLRNVSYGPDANQRMDVYLPPAGQAVQGVIFMVHGGGWKHGDKRHDNVVDEKVARWVPKGLALVSINYRMLPEAPVQTQADDVRQALAHAQRLATQWQVPADRFVLMGHSAGAHLVTLVSANPGLALAQGAQPWLGVVSLDSAAMDVPRVMKQRHMKLYDEAFGTDPAYWQAVSPWHQLTASVPPSLPTATSRSGRSSATLRWSTTGPTTSSRRRSARAGSTTPTRRCGTSGTTSRRSGATPPTPGAAGRSTTRRTTTTTPS